MVVTLGMLVALGAALVLFMRGPVVLRAPPPVARPELSEERLRETVRVLTVDMHPRDYRHVENLDRAAGWIAERMRRDGIEVGEQVYTVSGEGTYRNVVATQRGSEPGAGVVIVGAHYDAFMGTPGADDNASGVAVLLELVRTLLPDVPRRTRQFVAFSTEEPPFFATQDQGSYRFATDLVSRGEMVHLMVAFDLVGVYSDESGSQDYPLPGMSLVYPRRGNFVAVVGDPGAGRWIRLTKRGLLAARALPVVSFRAPSSLPGVDWSDHLPFRRLGMPGVLVTDTAFMRNPRYHGPDDTMDTLDFAAMASLVHGMHGVLREADALR